MSDLYIEARLQAIKDIASASCADIKDADNIASFCDEIYSAIPNLDKIIEELELHSFELGTDTLPAHYVRLNDAIEIVKQGGDANRNVVDMHLCDTCKKTYPECDGKNVKFGCDIDTYPNTRQNKDNIFYCDGYVKRENKKTNADRIVKQGGDANDVCKWRQTSTARYRTSCGYKLLEFFDTKACYCKQCGKKIKVIQNDN